jgi:hypothetical protein
MSIDLGGFQTLVPQQFLNATSSLCFQKGNEVNWRNSNIDKPERLTLWIAVDQYLHALY